MGCDIHLVVERRNGNGQWERVLPPPEAYDPWLKEQAEKKAGKDSYYSNRVRYVWYGDRNYNLFAILADVRNDFDFKPIAGPRGLPDDLSAEVVKLTDPSDDDDSNDVWLGDHSHSCLTVQELLDYNWDQETMEGGWVDPWNFELWRQRGQSRPDAWCKGVSGQGIEHISAREMAHKIDEGDIQWEGPEPAKGSWDGRKYSDSLSRSMKTWGLPKGSVGAAIAEGRHYYCYVEWKMPYRDAAGRFYEQILPELRKLGDPKDVRIVFGFDS
jgi:hypothetical protein